MRLTVAICDDNKEQIAGLRRLLEQWAAGKSVDFEPPERGGYLRNRTDDSIGHDMKMPFIPYNSRSFRILRERLFLCYFIQSRETGEAGYAGICAAKRRGKVDKNRKIHQGRDYAERH